MLSDNPAPSIYPGSSSYRFIQHENFQRSPESPGHTNNPQQTPHSPLSGLRTQPNNSYIPEVIQDMSVRTCPSQSTTRTTALPHGPVATHPARHPETYQKMKSNSYQSSSRFCSNEQLIHSPKKSSDSDKLLDHKKTDPGEDYVLFHDERRVGPGPRVRPKYIQLSPDYTSQVGIHLSQFDKCCTIKTEMHA